MDLESIETDRLILRKGKLSECEMMYNNFYCQEETVKYAIWNAHKNLDECRQEVERMIQYQIDHFSWFVYTKTNNEPIGFFSFKEVENKKYSNFALYLGKNFVRHGYGTEIMTKIIDILRKKGAKVLEYACFPDNIASKKLVHKIGFVYDRTEEIEKHNKHYIEDFYILKL